MRRELALTEEEQRYAKAWAKLRGFEKLALWVMTPLVGSLSLAMASKFLVWKVLANVFGVAFLAFVLGGASIGMYFTTTFKCPRCQRQFLSGKRYQRKTDCYTCGLPRFASRNPDSNWKPN
jgi:hypothetical protein